MSYWTEERVERLKQLWGEGKSSSWIARALGGTTRNGVIGKVHRLGLAERVTTKRTLSLPQVSRSPKTSLPAFSAEVHGRTGKDGAPVSGRRRARAVSAWVLDELLAQFGLEELPNMLKLPLVKLYEMENRDEGRFCQYPLLLRRGDGFVYAAPGQDPHCGFSIADLPRTKEGRPTYCDFHNLVGNRDPKKKDEVWERAYEMLKRLTGRDPVAEEAARKRKQGKEESSTAPAAV